MIPINVDRNVSFRDYDQFGESKLLVSSIFETIQGEGIFAGHPSTFVRFAGCNIGQKIDCAFCDTKFDFDKGEVVDVDILADRLCKSPHKLVVLTGGEPLLQMPAISNLIKKCQHKTFQFETNGYYINKVNLPRDLNVIPNNIVFVVSPKASVALGAYADLKFELKVRGTRNKFYLKYVLSSDESSLYHTVPEQHLEFARKNRIDVYVSGMAVYKKSYPDGRISSIWDADEIDQLQTAKNYRYVADYAMRNQLLVSLQTHLFLGVD